MRRYVLLIQARNFHYENFSKWSSYFIVAIGALFVALYSKPESDPIKIENIILILGYLTSLFWYWSNKGYYFWNINFITLTHYYERKLLKWDKKKSIYSVMANKNLQNDYTNPISGANISTSKVAILFSFLVCAFWGSILTYKVTKYFCNCTERSDWFYIFSFLISVISTVFLSSTIGKYLLASKINHLDDLKYNQDTSKR